MGEEGQRREWKSGRRRRRRKEGDGREEGREEGRGKREGKREGKKGRREEGKKRRKEEKKKRTKWRKNESQSDKEKGDTAIHLHRTCIQISSKGRQAGKRTQSYRSPGWRGGGVSPQHFDGDDDDLVVMIRPEGVINGETTFFLFLFLFLSSPFAFCRSIFLSPTKKKKKKKKNKQ
jgi:hypothetical protein